MNTPSCVLCSLALALFLAGCRTATPAAQPDGLNLTGTVIHAVPPEHGPEALLPQPGQGSMKGFEVYSWQEEDEWVFTVLIGTNRQKALDEIQAPSARLEGIEELRAVLESMPAGEVVTWLSPVPLGLPPEDILQEVRETCARQELELSMPR
jgi:hypothetical protein